MIPALVLMVLAAPAAPAPVTKLAAVPFVAVDLPAGKAEVYVEQLSVSLRTHGFSVTTPKDIGTALGLERQRQLLGCAEASCLVELAGALGVEGVVNGQVVRTAEAFRVALKVVSPKDGSVLFSFADSAPTEDGLYAALERGAQEAAVALLGLRLVKSTVPVVVTIVGGVAVVVGLVFAGRAGATYELLERRGAAALEFQSLAPIVAQGKLEQGLALGFLGAGGLGVLGGLLWYALAPLYPVKVALGAVPGRWTAGLEVMW